MSLIALSAILDIVVHKKHCNWLTILFASQYLNYMITRQS